MRVTIATRIYLPETSAASFRLDALARELVASGHEVTVVTATAPRRMGIYEAGRIRVRRAPVLRNRDGYVRGYLQYLSFDVPLWFRLLFARHPDVIIAEPPPTTGAVVQMIARIRRIPYVYYAADLWSDAVASIGGRSLTVRVLRRMESRVLARAAAVLTVNDELASRMRQLSPGARIEAIGNGVDTAIFRPDGPIAADSGYAVYAGTMSEWQGVDVFVRALAHAPIARIVFLGQGTARSDLEGLAMRLGVADRVDFRDPLPAADAACWIRGATVALVSLASGQGYDFALPTKVMAALACGTPVVFSGSDVGPAPALLASSPGRDAGVSAGSDPVGVAAAMTAAFEAPLAADRRAALAAWAAQTVSLAAVAARGGTVVESVR